MLPLINKVILPVRACCAAMLDFVVALFPEGVLWGLLGIAVFVVVTAAVLYGIVRLLFHLHSGEHVIHVTLPFTISHIVFGVVIGIIGMIEPNDQWMTWLNVVLIGWILVVMFRIITRTRESKNSRYGRLFYMAIGLAYWIELFVVGLFIFHVIYAAVVLAILVFFGLAFVGGMLKTNLMPSLGGGGFRSGTNAGRREAELDDGTRIVEEGASWREVGGSNVYRENLDGTFSRTS